MPTLADLQAAIRERDADRVGRILGAAPALAAERPPGAPSPLLLAAYLGVAPVIALLRARAAPDACEAAALGEGATLRALLDRDPGVAGARSGDGWPALHLAAFFGRGDAVALLLERGASVAAVSGTPEGNQALQAAISGACDAAVVERLLAAGADPNAGGAGGITALHSAAARGDEAVTRLLLRSGARADARLGDGRTPADLAAERGHPALAALLRAR